MKKNTHVFIVFISIVCCMRCSLFHAHKQADPPVFKELSHGVYKTAAEELPPKDTSTVQDSIDHRLLYVADTIPAVIGTSFGMEYQIDSKGLNDVTIRRVWIFPQVIVDKKGKRYDRIDRRMPVTVNEPHFTYYKFVKKYEMVKGKWILQIYHKDKLLHQRIFIVK